MQLDILDDWSTMFIMNATRASAEDTRNRILDAGQAAIRAKSFNGCGLKEILDTAGVPKGSFYYYFKSKEDFGLTVIEKSAYEHADLMRSLLLDRRVQSPRARIRAYFDWAREEYINSDLVPECIIPRLALEVSHLCQPMRMAIRGAFRLWGSILAQAISEAQAAGEVVADLDADRIADFVIDAWEGVSLRVQIDRDIAVFDHFVGLVFDKLLPTPKN